MTPLETNIHTLRHAQTTYGAEKRYAGSIDVSLSPQGVKDCVAAKEALKSVTFDAVISSPMRRAVETAQLVAPEAPEFVLQPLCVERGFGIMEGLTWDEVQRLEPAVLFVSVGGDLHSVNPKDGEPFEDLWQRARSFKRWVFRNYSGRNVLIVSHGVFLQSFHGLLRGFNCIESLTTHPPNLELTRFRFVGDCLMEQDARRLVDESGRPSF